MRVSVFGKRKLNFISKEGNEVDGWQIYVGFEADGVEGLLTDKMFLSSKKFRDIAVTVGQDYEVTFDRFAKVDTIVKA